MKDLLKTKLRKHAVPLIFVCGLGLVAWGFAPQLASLFGGGHQDQNTGGETGASHAHHGMGPGGRDAMMAPVAVATAQKADVQVTRPALGTVTPLANITVRTQINGQLQELTFQEGQIVQKGDALALVDPRPYQMTLQQAEGSLQHDQALLKNAQLDLDRYRKLVGHAAVSTQQVDTQEALVQQYQGTVLTDQAQIDSAKLNIAYCHITAPVTGRVGLRQVDVGNYVQISDTNGIVTITQLNPISVIFTLPEDDVPVVMKRLAEGAVLPVTAYDRTQSTKIAEGKLIAVDNAINTSTGTVKLRAEFENEHFTLFPNQFVNVTLLVDTLHDAVTISPSAIQRGAPGTFVYLLKKDNTVAVTPIKLGSAQADLVAVTEGLAVGDVVVTGGADKLRDGMTVKLSSDNGGDSKPALAVP